jgi:CBS domain-containing protein
MMAAAGHAEVPMTIREILSLKGAHVHTIDSDRTVLDAIAVRHLPVMDGGRVAGMISIGDLVKAKLDTAEYQNRYLWEYIHGR